MDEQAIQKMNESTERLVAAAEALQQTLAVISAQQQEISAKVDRIVAAIDEKRLEAEADVPHLPKEGRCGAPRKTMSPLVTAILAKNGVEDGTDALVLDKALAGLSPEQRIAVKSEMAKAGLIQ